MLRFAANISLLFTEHAPLDRPEAAARAGFGAVEMLFPYSDAVQEWRAVLQGAGIPLVLINTPAGDWDKGERGFAAVAGAEAEFREAFLEALRYARALDVGLIHVMAGIAQGSAARHTFVENLRWAAGQAAHQQLTIEPINRFDMPGYFLSDFDQALGILDEVAAPNLHLQFDAYHAHRITGDVPATWDRVRSRVAHVQVAGAEGRHEPVAGEIDYPAFFAQLDTVAYGGWVSGEYWPRGHTEDGLDWIRR